MKYICPENQPPVPFTSDNLAWMLKLYLEKYIKKEYADEDVLVDRLCFQDLGYCERWRDPEEIARAKVEEEAVFW